MARTNYFIKIDGIQGQSAAKGHTNEIELESWNWGASNDSTGGVGGGQTVLKDLTFETKDGKAGPLLMLSCATGKQIPAALLTCRQATGKQDDYLKIKLTNVFVTSYHANGNGSASEGEAIYPSETVTLGFQKIELSRAPATQDKGVGTFDTHWYDHTTQDGK